jgi:hypothetical protein
MTTIPNPGELLGEFDALVKRAEEVRVALERALEDAELHSRSLTQDEISSLTTLASALERINRASSNGNGAGSAAAIDALHTWLGQSQQLVTPLRDRFATLGMTAPAVLPGTPGSAAPPQPPPAPLPRTLMLGGTPMSGPDVEHFQRLLNFRYECWNDPQRVAVSGVYDADTRRAAWDVARRLGVDDADLKNGFTPELRELIRHPGLRTATQRAHAEHNKRKPAKVKVEHHAARASGLGAAIDAAGGRYGNIIAREAARSGLEPALVCAVIEQESTFRNVFGHDNVRNPIKGGEVTEARYQQYLANRKAKLGMNGVGPMQLTWYTLQDRADALGGCWKVGPNIRVGCEYLSELIKAKGKQAGVQAYNGASGFAYANSVLAREAKWAQKLAGAATTQPPAKTKPRTFRVKPHAMTGEDVRAFQRVLNARLDAWGIDTHVTEDGEYGKDTRHAAIQVCKGLGIAPADYAHGITPAVRTIIRDPKQRSAAQLALAKANRAWRLKLRQRHTESGSLRERAWREARRLNDLNVRETGGNNRGEWVLKIIKANAGAGPEAWCGDFVAWCYRKAGAKSVNRNWAAVRLYLPLTGLKATKTPLKGDIVRFTWSHVGLFGYWCDATGAQVKGQGSHFRTIEGNTTGSGGEGVHLKLHPRADAKDFIRVGR